MTGQGIGLAGILKNHGVNCPMFHCIIHQEALCAKSLQMSDVMITNSVTRGWGRGGGGYSPPIGMSTKMQNGKNTTFLALL